MTREEETPYKVDKNYFDVIIDFEPNRFVRLNKTYIKEDKIFESHFPGFPVVPGTHLIESCAKAAGICLRKSDSKLNPFLAAIKFARFYKFVHPNKEIIIESRIKQLSATGALIEAQINNTSNELIMKTNLLIGFRIENCSGFKL